MGNWTRATFGQIFETTNEINSKISIARDLESCL